MELLKAEIEKKRKELEEANLVVSNYLHENYCLPLINL